MYKYLLAFNQALMRLVHFSLIFLIRLPVNYTDHGSLISFHASNPLIQVQPSRSFIFLALGGRKGIIQQHST